MALSPPSLTLDTHPTGGGGRPAGGGFWCAHHRDMQNMVFVLLLMLYMGLFWLKEWRLLNPPPASPSWPTVRRHYFMWGVGVHCAKASYALYLLYACGVVVSSWKWQALHMGWLVPIVQILLEGRKRMAPHHAMK